MDHINSWKLNGSPQIPIHFAPRRMLMSVPGITSKLADFIFLLRRQGIAMTKSMLGELRSSQNPTVPMFRKSALDCFAYSCKRSDFPTFNTTREQAVNQTPCDIKFSPRLSSRMIPKSPVSEDAFLRASTNRQRSRNLGMAASEHMHGSHSKQTPREEVALVNKMCNPSKEHSSCCVVRPFVPAELNKDVSGTDTEQSSSESVRPKNIVHDILKYYRHPSSDKKSYTEVATQSPTVLTDQHGDLGSGLVHSSVEEDISIEVKGKHQLENAIENTQKRLESLSLEQENALENLQSLSTQIESLSSDVSVIDDLISDHRLQLANLERECAYLPEQGMQIKQILLILGKYCPCGDLKKPMSMVQCANNSCSCWYHCDCVSVSPHGKEAFTCHGCTPRFA